MAQLMCVKSLTVKEKGTMFKFLHKYDAYIKDNILFIKTEQSEDEYTDLCELNEIHLRFCYSIFDNVGLTCLFCKHWTGRPQRLCPITYDDCSLKTKEYKKYME